MIGAFFSGQGSQHIGMGGFLIENYPQAKTIFEQASEVLGFDLIDMVLNGDEATLALTKNTQPALLTHSYATFKVLEDLGHLKVKAGAGHSVGEYAALVSSGAVQFQDAVRLVRLRGELMQEAVPAGQGGMLAVMGLEPSEITKMCLWVMETSGLTPLEPANFNSPGQTVISGNLEAITWAQKNFDPKVIGIENKKVRLIPLKVSAPFHCSMMRPAEDKMAEEIRATEFKTPKWGVIQNYTGTLVTDPETLKENLIRQISAPVKWVDCVNTMLSMGIKTSGEFGPGKVLSGLLKKIDDQSLMTCFNLNSLDELNAFNEQLSLS